MWYSGLTDMESPLIVKLLLLSIWTSTIAIVGCCTHASLSNLGETTPDQTLMVGNQLTINCRIFNNTIKYNKNFYEVNSSMILFKFKNRYYSEDRVHIINSTVAQLRVKEASVEDKGMYNCLLNISGLDNNPLVCVTNVTVGYKPQDVKDFKCIDYTSLKSRKLKCSWNPQYSPIATTYRYEQLNATHSMHSKCGHIPTENSCEWNTHTEPPYPNISPKFYFLLVGKNQFGTNEQLFFVDRYSIIKPNIPQSLLDIEVNTENITISWTAPEYIEYNEEVLKNIIYEIRYFRIDSHDSNNAKSDPVIIDGIRNQTTYVLTNLIPFNSYNISIRCKTIQSKSDEYWSEFSSIIVKTRADVPYLSPVLIPQSFQTVKNTEGNRSITLYWKPIPIEHRNAPDFHYTIEWRQKYRRKRRATNNLYDNPVNIKSENSTYTFIHMDSNTAYTFKIYGVNSEGISKNYTEITVDKNDNIPRKPSNIDVFSYGGGRYEVQWGQPRDNIISGPIVNYSVFWCQTLRPRPFPCEGAIDWKHTTNRSIALELPDIKMNYQFAVSANTLKSSSGMSWAECIVPIDGRLDKLNEVRLGVVYSTSINVFWKLDCPAQKRVVEGYKISFSKCSRDQSNDKVCHKQKSVTVDNSRENYTLNNLDPYSEYKVTVVALTDSAGPSDESDPKYAETHEASPEDAPYSLKITDTTIDSIVLNWRPPLKPNGQISYYDVLYNDKTEKLNASQCSNGCSFRASHLLSYHEYNFKVRACNKLSLCSPYTQLVFKRTLPSFPSRMDPPRTEIINATSVRISWSPPIMPNGPVDHYLLKLIPRDNKTEPSIYNISAKHKEYVLTLDCDSYKDGSASYQQQYAVRIVAVNRRRTEELVGDYSDRTHLNACLVTDENDAYIIGIIVGGALGLMLFVIVLYMLVRWMKRKINAYNSLSIELPKGLNAPQLVTDNLDADQTEIFDNLPRTDSSPNIASDNTLLFMEADDLFKNRHGYRMSNASSLSTEEVTLRNTPSLCNNGYIRMIGIYNGQHESVSSNSYNGEVSVSSDSGVETDAQHNPKDHNNLQLNNKVGPKPLPRVDEMSTRNSDSSASKDSGLDVSNGTRNKKKRKQKTTRSNKISTTLPTRNEVVNPLYDHPFNHSICIYSLLTNSEPSIFNLPIREDDNMLNDLTKFYKPEMAKSLSNIIQNSNPSDRKVNCIICDLNNSESKSFTRAALPNSYYCRFGAKRLIHGLNIYETNHLKSICSDNKKANNGYVTVSNILNDSDQNGCKSSRARLGHDCSQNSYNVEVSLASSNGDIDHANDVIKPNLYDYLSECEKIQNNSLPNIENYDHNKTVDSSVSSSVTPPKDNSSNTVECKSVLNETIDSNVSPHNCTKSKASPNHLFKTSNGYVLREALTQSNLNVVNPNGYVII